MTLWTGVHDETMNDIIFLTILQNSHGETWILMTSNCDQASQVWQIGKREMFIRDAEYKNTFDIAKI